MNSFLKIALLVSIPLIFFLWYQSQQTAHAPALEEKPVIQFNEKTPLRVTVVGTDADRTRGLSGTPTLAPTEGMLFVFPSDDFHGIWMRDMLFPIDVAWVSRDGIIVDIASNLPPQSFPRVFEPKEPARFVIEANAYFFDTWSIRIGDKVTLPREVMEY